MATRTRQRGFDGDVDRWVSASEVRQIVGEVGELKTVGELASWCGQAENSTVAASDLAPLLPSGAGRAFVSVAMSCARAPFVGGDLDQPIADRDKAVRAAVVELAASRRHRAVRDWAEEHRRSVPVAVTTLGRCPACGVALDLRMQRDLYCRDHGGDPAQQIVGEDGEHQPGAVGRVDAGGAVVHPGAFFEVADG